MQRHALTGSGLHSAHDDVLLNAYIFNDVILFVTMNGWKPDQSSLLGKSKALDYLYYLS